MRPAIVLLLIAAIPVPGCAATLYNINFTATSGTAPTSGSFTYDPGTGFSAFIVNWDGLAFDLDPGANAPLLGFPNTCANRASNFQYGFIIMSQSATGCTATYSWFAQSLAGGGRFEFDLNAPASSFDNIPVVRGGLVTSFGNGTWSISAVPDPNSLALVVLGTLAVAGKRYLQRRSR